MFFPIYTCGIYMAMGEAEEKLACDYALSGGGAAAHMSSSVWRVHTQFGQDESPRNTRFGKYILLLYRSHACDLRAPSHITLLLVTPAP